MSSFTNAPVSRALVVGLVGGSIAVSLFDVKHDFYILIDTHIWRYRQFWRAAAFQLCYTNSSEVLFGAMVLYHLRVVERMWGSRKFASFLLATWIMTSFITPFLLAIFLRPLAAGLFNYLPAGPTPVIFAILAQYYAIIPHIYRYRVATSPSAAPTTTTSTYPSPASTSGPDGGGARSVEEPPFSGLTFSDKSTRYFVAIQLALFQWPASLVGATVGWVVGHLWRNGVIPGAMTRWRLPGWMVGMASQKRSSAEFEGLRRRLEGENSAGTAAAVASGAQRRDGTDGGTGPATTTQRRTMGQQIMDQFQGAL